VAVALEVQAEVLGITVVVVLHNLGKHRLFALQFIQAVHILIAVILAQATRAVQADQAAEPLLAVDKMLQAVLVIPGPLPVIHMAVVVAQLLFLVE
jgi:hypothetical protein